jgi:DNA-damage-inducible protein D
MDSDNQDPSVPRTSPFEAIRMKAEDGSEYWSARDLSKVLGYTEWRNFTTAIEKAKEACQNSGQAISDHFVDVNKMVTLGSGSQRKVQDYHLSRYACYLIVQNADPSKPIVALGQTYFAVQTRRQELQGFARVLAWEGLLPGTSPLACHSERSEESLWLARNDPGRRFFAALRMTGSGTERCKKPTCISRKGSLSYTGVAGYSVVG